MSRTLPGPRPEWTLSFNGASGTYLMLNPALNEVNQFIVDIVSDLVRRYDLDGIHFDDYFYPYSPKITDEDLPQFQADPRADRVHRRLAARQY